MKKVMLELTLVIQFIAVGGGEQYRVHLKGSDWLPWVDRYNINDSKNGYAVFLGREIDLIQCEGARLYATAYNV